MMRRWFSWLFSNPELPSIPNGEEDPAFVHEIPESDVQETIPSRFTPSQVEKSPYTPATLELWEAIRLKDKGMFDKAMKNKAEVEELNDYQLNALSLSILEQNDYAFEQLLTQANLNAKVGNFGHTILTFALSKQVRRHFAVRLLESGVDPTLTGTNQVTPLIAAILYAGAHGSEMEADASQDWTLIQTLVQHSHKQLNVEDRHQRSAIKIALQKYQRDEWLMPNVVDLLLSNQARLDIDATLRNACENGYTTLVPVLLRHGAAVLAGNTRGQPPLALAASNGFFEICEMLIAASADVNSVDPDGATPLMEAATHGHQDCVSLLLQHGAMDPPYPGATKTAMSMAAGNGFKDVAQLIQVFFDKKKLNTALPSSQPTQHSARRL